MKIITDPELINYRLGLQSLLYRSCSDLAVISQELHDKFLKIGKLSKDDFQAIRNKSRENCLMFYELEYGSYFLDRDKSFQDKVVDDLTKSLYEFIIDPSNEDVFHDVYVGIYAEMDQALRENINSDQNGS